MGKRPPGELVSGYGLADPTQAKTVRFEAGAPAATDGPYVEIKEVRQVVRAKVLLLVAAGVSNVDCAAGP